MCDPSSLRFLVNPPEDFVGEVDIQITVEDSQGNEATDTFKIIIQEGEPDNQASLGESGENQGSKQAFNAQVRDLWNPDSIFGSDSLVADTADGLENSTFLTAEADLQLARFGAISTKLQSEHLLQDADVIVTDRT